MNKEPGVYHIERHNRLKPTSSEVGTVNYQSIQTWLNDEVRECDKIIAVFPDGHGCYAAIVQWGIDD